MLEFYNGMQNTYIVQKGKTFTIVTHGETVLIPEVVIFWNLAYSMISIDSLLDLAKSETS